MTPMADMLREPLIKAAVEAMETPAVDYRAHADALAEALRVAVALSREPRPKTALEAIPLVMRQRQWVADADAVLTAYSRASRPESKEGGCDHLLLPGNGTCIRCGMTTDGKERK